MKLVEGVQMDASSIAKGLGVDLVAEFFDRKGVQNYMIEIGGEIRVKGESNKRRPWHIGVDKPIDDATAANRELQLVLALRKGRWRLPEIIVVFTWWMEKIFSHNKP